MKILEADGFIRLEPLGYKHAFVVFQAIDLNRSFFSAWLPFVEHTRTQEDTELFIRTTLATPESERNHTFVIWYEDRFVGMIGVKDTDTVNMKTEIGYWLIESMTGRGIMTRAVARLTEFLFESFQMNRIQIKCGVGNEKSAAIPKRLGFSFEGVERAGEKHGDGFIDLEVYSLLSHEWCENKCSR